jgi:hypothetical protein
VATSIATQPSIPTLRRDRDTKKPLKEVSANGFDIRGNGPELIVNCSFFPFYLVFLKLLTLFLHLHFLS